MEPSQDVSTLMLQIAMMKHVSRDRNVVQFYGACLNSDSLMLVVEFMEVSSPCIESIERTFGRAHGFDALYPFRFIKPQRPQRWFS